MQGFSNKYLNLQVNNSSFPLSLLISPLVKVCFIARSLTNVGQASMNQALKVVATKSFRILFVGILMKQALMVVATKSCSDST
ncbi:hypothetical protein Bca4012_031615 [Brassica carinata]